jgi:indolepyruvate ferredoxin oxidoreductase beta subunit
MDTLMAEIESLDHHIALDADDIAKEIGAARSANMVILGAAAPFLQIPRKKIENAIRQLFAKKGADIVKLNLDAFEAGFRFAVERQNLKVQ